jgi:hypothetical protein
MTIRRWRQLPAAGERTLLPLSATAEGPHLSIADRYTQRLIDQDYLRRMPMNPFVTTLPISVPC